MGGAGELRTLIETRRIVSRCSSARVIGHCFGTLVTQHETQGHQRRDEMALLNSSRTDALIETLEIGNQYS